MNIRRIRRWLFAGSAMMLAAAAAILATALQADIAPHSTASHREDAVASPYETAPQPLPALDAFEPLWIIDLRRPLYDPPPLQPARAEPPPPPPVHIKLTGTILAPDHALAILELRGGEIRMLGIGEHADGAEILEITPDYIRIMHHGRERKVELEG